MSHKQRKFILFVTKMNHTKYSEFTSTDKVFHIERRAFTLLISTDEWWGYGL